MKDCTYCEKVISLHSVEDLVCHAMNELRQAACKSTSTGPAVISCLLGTLGAFSMLRTGGWSAENVMNPVTGWGEGREDERVQRPA